MGFSFSLDDFLNYFSAGFFFVSGISITNWEYMNKILPFLRDNIGDGFILICLIIIYIIGIIVYGFTSFLSILSQDIERFINKYNKIIFVKIINILYLSSFYLFFRRWSVVGTFNRLSRKNKLPREISHIKTYNKLSILEEKILEKSKVFSRINFLRSQFFQTIADSILLVFFINILLIVLQLDNLQSIFIGWIAITSFLLFFTFKGFSSVFARWHFMNIARKSKALELY